MRVPLANFRRSHRRTAATLGLLAIAALWLVGVRAQSNQLRLVSTAWPPFTNAPGQPRFALDLVETALGRIGVTTTTTIVDAAQFTPALLTGQFDGSAAAWKDPERERVLLFSQPYLENRLILVGRQGADVSARSLADLKGKRVAIVDGYAYGDTVDNSGPTFVRSGSEEDSLKQLLSSAADYTLMDDLVVKYITEHYASEARTRLQIGVTPLITRQLFFAVRRSRPDAQAIIDRFNSQVRAMIVDHTYHRLLHVNWIRADVNGDGLVEFVPQSDTAGPLEPQSAYSIFSVDPTTPEPRTEPERRYYVGGNIYTQWATVPDRYKSVDTQRPDPTQPGGSTASIFTFSW